MFFNLYTPISYNTNFESVLAHYGFGYCGGFCNPFASLFNGYSNFGAFARNYPSLFPTQCPDSFNIRPYSFTYNPMMTGLGLNFTGGVIRDVSLPEFGMQQVVNPYQYQTPQKFEYIQSDMSSAKPSKTAANSAVIAKTNEKTEAQKTDSTKTSTQRPLQTKETPTAAVKNTSSKPSTATNPNQVTKTASQDLNAQLRNEFVSTARKYSNCGEYNGSQRKFCINSTCQYDDPFNQEWCTDFVTYVVKETYRNNGKTPPSGFGSHDVRTLKNWAIHKNYFIRTSNKPQKGKFIAENIKPGDIIILNEHGASHTGFVTGVDSNTGVIRTIEGNRDDRVTTYSYSPNYPDISGFIRLT